MEEVLHESTQKLKRLSKLECGWSLVLNTSFISPGEKDTQVFAEEEIKDIAQVVVFYL